MSKSIFEEANYKTIRNRIESLKLDNMRQWGKMDAAQMLTHCSRTIEPSIGRVPFVDQSNFLSKTLIKWVVLRMIKKGSMGRNSPTVKSFVVADERAFETEKQQLLDNLKQFYEKGLTQNIGRHPGFGNLTNQEWGGLVYLHLDHHLQQFST
jgi:Protein of unknown function (DUF1569)